MTELELTLLQDARLSREARLMGLYLATLGYGEHEVSYQDWQRVLGRGERGGIAKSDRVAGWVIELETYGWIRRRPGGRGATRYELLYPPQGGADASVLYPHNGGREVHTPLKGVQNESQYPPQGGAEGPLGGVGGEVGVTSTAVGREDAQRGREAVAASSEHPLDPAAEAALDERLTGCRDSLRDYLRRRVSPEKQYGYVQVVSAMIQGHDPGVFMRPDGGRIALEERAGLVSVALNEMLQTGERSAEKPMKWPDGDVRNLRTKLGILSAPPNRSPPKSPPSAEKPKKRGINERWGRVESA